MKKILSVLLLSIVLIIGFNACNNNCKKGNDSCCKSKEKQECCDKASCDKCEGKGECSTDNKCCKSCTGEPAKKEKCCRHDEKTTTTTNIADSTTTEISK